MKCGNGHGTEDFVHLERMILTERGFGCLACGTAVEYKHTCENPKCKKEYSAYFQSEPFECLSLHLCEACVLKELSDNSVSLNLKKIPSWRLNMDDASSDEVMKKGGSGFGMPRMSSEKWQDHYAQDFEKKKLSEFKKQQEKEAKETLSSIQPQSD